MASNPGNGSSPDNPGGFKGNDPNQRTLNVWSKPIDEKDQQAAGGNGQRPTITDAVGMIKPEDFANVAETPCARNGFLTGIGAGFGAGGLRFVVGGNIGKATNFAAGFFILGSVASYEYCQYLRRCEKRDMKRHIEVVNRSRREQAQKQAEEQKKQMEEKKAQKSWYKFW
ncbi:cytochrome c oxidase assembly protein subunit 20 [Geosmithia morbida]|uniref:Cytochrome c oxidase assembly protein COX20, mitochondrial n=1 Tax=Geosmithia morbida TaxID=1094350 RepID=A0A9P4Z2E7_9HYPO|nr:cytochrome c oxidase assembly protein subunit 20 [Geosmithia morbida]KAF4126174.1 cytochrome c oxidase assembly protein subunit 20 [Geosmithia morbida]